MISFGANLSSTAGLGGGFAPSLTFAAGLTIIPAPANYVDFAGNLGGVSLYGKLNYGQGLYSLGGAFAPSFAGDLDVIGIQALAGDLRPVVIFSATGLSLDVGFAGNLAPQIGLGADLSLDIAFGAILLDGGFYFIVDFTALSMISGPLWGGAAPCPSPPWAPSEPCPPSLWTPTGPCDPVEWDERELCNG